MQQLSLKQTALVGVTLFGMFFGAGNLIFPPFLGALSGQDFWFAIIGFCLSAVILPVLAVVSVARTQGLVNLADRVHPAFSFIFVLLVYLSIGPCLGIPRTASISFEMALAPYVDHFSPTIFSVDSHTFLQAFYSVIFFTLAGLVALDPSKLTQRLGKVMSPILLTLIALLFVSCLIYPLGEYGSVQAPYAGKPLSQGLLEGYQTMDAIAALNFGFIIAMNIRQMGVTDQKLLVRETMLAGVVAGILLALIYMILGHIGASSVGAGIAAENGAQTLAAVCKLQFGALGQAVVGSIFFLACFNVCVGLFSCVSNYFTKTFPVLGYRAWLLLFAIFSMIVSNAGLTTILKFSVPVLIAIYPVCIVLTFLGLAQKFFVNKAYVYPVTIVLTTLVAIVSAATQLGYQWGVLTDFVNALPMAEHGFAWVVPALLGIVIGMMLPSKKVER